MPGGLTLDSSSAPLGKLSPAKGVAASNVAHCLWSSRRRVARRKVSDVSNRREPDIVNRDGGRRTWVETGSIRLASVSQLARLMQRFDEFAHGCAGFG
jgi:hypothetical protein